MWKSGAEGFIPEAKWGQRVAGGWSTGDLVKDSTGMLGIVLQSATSHTHLRPYKDVLLWSAGKVARVSRHGLDLLSRAIPPVVDWRLYQRSAFATS